MSRAYANVKEQAGGRKDNIGAAPQAKNSANAAGYGEQETERRTRVYDSAGNRIVIRIIRQLEHAQNGSDEGPTRDTKNVCVTDRPRVTGSGTAGQSKCYARSQCCRGCKHADRMGGVTPNEIGSDRTRDTTRNSDAFDRSKPGLRRIGIWIVWGHGFL